MSVEEIDGGNRFRHDLLDWAQEHYRSFKWRESDRSFYEVFVAEFLLTQTPAQNVADVYPVFLDKFPDLDAVRAAGVTDVQSVVEPLGFQRMRAEALSQIASNHESLPRERERLVELPRLGPYVADATLCFAGVKARPILDRNVNRVYDRVFGERYPEEQADRLQFAASLVPGTVADARTFNYALLDFGAAICQKREPLCRECPAQEYCSFYREERD